jgi:hypothetical protein
MVTYNIENEPTVSRWMSVSAWEDNKELFLGYRGPDSCNISIDSQYFVLLPSKNNIELYSRNSTYITEIHGNDTTIKSYKLVVYLLKE